MMNIFYMPIFTMGIFNFLPNIFTYNSCCKYQKVDVSSSFVGSKKLLDLGFHLYFPLTNLNLKMKLHKRRKRCWKVIFLGSKH